MSDIRRSINFALIGHGGDGKTTLADSLLFAVTDQRKVDAAADVAHAYSSFLVSRFFS